MAGRTHERRPERSPHAGGQSSIVRRVGTTSGTIRPLPLRPAAGSGARPRERTRRPAVAADSDTDV